TSHELRTPLNGIINCIRVVQEGYCDSKEEEREFLQQADDAAIHLLGIINDVLDISKIEAGKLSVKIEPVNLHRLLNEVVDLHQVSIQQKNLHLEMPVWGKDLYVMADMAKLKQVLINIVSNAIKFTDYGMVRITITTQLLTNDAEFDNYQYTLASKANYQRDIEASINQISLVEEKIAQPAITEEEDLSLLALPQVLNQYVLIMVEDTGIGIEPSQQHKLFNPFVMVDGSTTRKFGGTGLGLAISRNLMDLMQGTITLESPGIGKGTTVSISIPLAEINFRQDIP
ncbi:MAG: sensor histidine kinase, partial [Waterburya sp.]